MKMRLTAALCGAALAAGCARAPVVSAPPAAEPPAPAAAPAPPAAPAFPTTPPALGPVRPLTLPTPERRTLPNGLEVLYVRHGNLPVVHATLVARGGSVDDPAATPGLASFVAEMLDEGAAGKSSLQLASALDQLGAELSASAGWDAVVVDLHALRDRFPAALGLMADVVVRPDFPAAEVARVKQERVTDLTRARDEPRAIAGNAFASLVYGAAHPYGRVPTLDATRRIGRAELQRFHRQFYRPGGATLVLVGDVDPAALHPRVEAAFGGWSGASSAPASLPASPQRARTTVYLVDKPGAAQSEIRIGHPGVARSSPDFYPLQVLNTILGGSFTSRLNTNLREQHGFAYGASSSFSMRRGEGPFLAASAVFTAKTDSAVVEFFRELRRIREESVPADELARAKNFLALGLPRRFETTEAVAAQLADLSLYGLPLDFYNTYVQRVMAVSAEDVRRVANQYVRPERAVVVVVGDRQTVEAGLRAVDLGPLEVRRVTEFVR